MANEKALTIDFTKHVISNINDDDVLLVGTGIQSNSAGLVLRPFADSTASVRLQNAAGTLTTATFDTTNQRVYVGGATAPSARLHITGGSATVAPFMLTSGTNLATPANGALEYDGSHLYFTLSSLRKQLDGQFLLSGFENRTDSSLSWNDTTKTLSVAVKSPATSFTIYDNGIRYSFSTTQSAVSTTTAGLHWFYFESGTLTHSTAGPGFDKCIVAAVFLNASGNAISIADERHGKDMSWKDHQYLHKTIGTRFETGLMAARLNTGSTGNVNGEAQISLTGGTIWDEDIDCSIVRAASPANPFEQELGLSTTTPGQFPIYYRSGTSADGWVRLAATTYPIYFTGTTAGYNRTSDGSLQPITSGHYGVMYLVATTSIGLTNGIQYQPVIVIMGQGDYTSLSAAQAVQFSDLSLGNLLSSEMKPIWKIVFQTKTNYTNGVKSYIAQITDLRNVAPLPSGTFVATSHGSLTGLTDPNVHPASSISTDTTNFNNNLSAADTTVQKALDTIDNLSIPASLTGYTDAASPYSTALGYQAGVDHGTSNVVVGYQAGLDTSTGANCVMIGYQAGASTYGSRNTFVGYRVAYNGPAPGTTGTDNVAIGHEALSTLGEGSHNICLGTNAGYRLIAGTGNVAIGSNVFGYTGGDNVTSGYNTGIGYNALNKLTTGAGNFAAGYAAMFNTVSSSYCTVIGYEAGLSLTSGSHNVAIGQEALYLAQTVAGNVAIGYRAARTSVAGGVTAIGHEAFGVNAGTHGGQYSVAVGVQAGYRIGTGTDEGNVLIGYQAGYGNATPAAATYNVAIGYQSLLTVSSGSSNVCIGNQAGSALTTGGSNVAIGISGQKITTGSSNVAIGGGLNGDVAAVITGSNNIAIGSGALSPSSGNFSNGDVIAIGRGALNGTAGAGVVAVGGRAFSLAGNTSQSVAIGFEAGYRLSTSCGDSVLIGYQAGYGNATPGAAENNIGIGTQALYNLSSGGAHVAIGVQAGYSLTTGGSATAIGYWSLKNATGAGNTGLGESAGYKVASGTYNTAVGYQAQYNTIGSITGSYNVALGALAMNGTGTVSGNDNIAIGRNTLARITGAVHNNVAIGKEAASWCTGSANVAIGNSTGAAITTGTSNVILGDTATSSGNLSGSYNVIAGYGAVSGSGLTSAAGNVALGYYALSHVSTGSHNVMIGPYAGNDSGASATYELTTGGYNVCIGYNARVYYTSNYNIAIGRNAIAGGSSLSYCIAIGDGAQATGGNGSIQLGYGINTRAGASLHVGGGTGYTGTAYTCYSSGGWTTFSDERIKKDIEPLASQQGLGLVLALQPVAYKLRHPGNPSNARTRYGLIAQQAREACESVGISEPLSWVDDTDPDLWAIDYDQLIAPLVKAVQELSAQVKELQAQLDALKGT